MERIGTPAEQTPTAEEITVLAKLAVSGAIEVDDFHTAETRAAASRILGFMEDGGEIPNYIEAVMDSNLRVMSESSRGYYAEREIRQRISGSANRFDIR